MSADWFVPLLATTAVLRGLGAGIILGMRVYAGLTVLGALLTIVLLTAAVTGSTSALVGWSLTVSLAATALGFIGTGFALPTMSRVWQAPDGDEQHVAELLDRFDRWHVFAAAWHVIAFVGLVIALAVGTERV